MTAAMWADIAGTAARGRTKNALRYKEMPQAKFAQKRNSEKKTPERQVPTVRAHARCGNSNLFTSAGFLLEAIFVLQLPLVQRAPKQQPAGISRDSFTQTLSRNSGSLVPNFALLLLRATLQQLISVINRSPLTISLFRRARPPLANHLRELRGSFPALNERAG